MVSPQTATSAASAGTARATGTAQATADELSRALRDQKALQDEQKRIAREIAKNNRKLKKTRRRTEKAKAKTAARQTGWTGPIIILNDKPYRVEYVSRPESVVGQSNLRPPSRNVAPSGTPKYLKVTAMGLPVLRILQGPPDDTYYAIARMNSGQHGYVWGRGYNPYTGEWASGAYDLTEADVIERSRGMMVIVDNGRGTAVTKSSTVRKPNTKAKRTTSAPKKPQTSKASKSKTTYTKEIIEANQRHILSYFTPAEFVEQIDYIAQGRMSPHRAMEMLVDGGLFLDNNSDVRQYLSSIGVKGNRSYSDDESWNVYRHLLVRDGSKLYESLTQKTKPKTARKTAKPSASKSAKSGSAKKASGKTAGKTSKKTAKTTGRR